MRLISWNVNGIRAAVKNGFNERLEALAPDVFGLQETKAADDEVRAAVRACAAADGYEVFSSSAEKKGYSGTAVLTRVAPVRVRAGLGHPGLDGEGRVLHAEFADLHFVTVYTPNASEGLKRLPFRSEWDKVFADFVRELAADRPLVVCGDLNVAHTALDLARPAANYNVTPGYTQTEIDGLSHLLAHAGLTDMWRIQHPDEVGYSWWSYRGGARERNVGWRLDYMLANATAAERAGACTLHPDMLGSDHCPVSLEVRL
ncbi:MAG: exodeoxyribonuclease III [Flavobacteriales bacterium]|jgi:exodeoxyribonuclease-3